MLYSQTFFILTLPTLEEKIPASSFGALEIFPVPQNTTYSVHLNIKMMLEKLLIFCLKQTETSNY